MGNRIWILEWNDENDWCKRTYLSSEKDAKGWVKALKILYPKAKNFRIVNKEINYGIPNIILKEDSK